MTDDAVFAFASVVPNELPDSRQIRLLHEMCRIHSVKHRLMCHGYAKWRRRRAMSHKTVRSRTLQRLNGRQRAKATLLAA
jgi:hypothetical protein